MLKRFQAAALEPGYRILIFNFPIRCIQKVFLVFFKKSETSHDNKINYAEGRELLHLINQEGEEEGHKYKEWVSRVCHDDGEFECVEKQEQEKERQEALVG